MNHNRPTKTTIGSRTTPNSSSTRREPNKPFHKATKTVSGGKSPEKKSSLFFVKDDPKALSPAKSPATPSKTKPPTSTKLSASKGSTNTTSGSGKKAVISPKQTLTSDERILQRKTQILNSSGSELSFSDATPSVQKRTYVTESSPRTVQTRQQQETIEQLQRQIRDQAKWSYYISDVLEKIKIHLERGELAANVRADTSLADQKKKYSEIQIRFEVFVDYAIDIIKKVKSHGGIEAIEKRIKGSSKSLRANQADAAIQEFLGKNYDIDQLRELLSQRTQDAQLIEQIRDEFGDEIDANDLQLASDEDQTLGKSIREIFNNDENEYDNAELIDLIQQLKAQANASNNQILEITRKNVGDDVENLKQTFKFADEMRKLVPSNNDVELTGKLSQCVNVTNELRDLLNIEPDSIPDAVRSMKNSTVNQKLQDDLDEARHRKQELDNELFETKKLLDAARDEELFAKKIRSIYNMSDDNDNLNTARKDHNLASAVRRVFDKKGITDENIPQTIERDSNLATPLRELFQLSDDLTILQMVKENRELASDNNIVNNLRQEVQNIKSNKSNDDLAVHIRKIFPNDSDDNIPTFIEKDSKLASHIRQFFKSGDDSYIISSIESNVNASNELQSKINEINSIRNELESYKSNLSDTRNEVERLQRENNQVREELNNRNTNLTTSSHDLENTSQQLNDLRREYEQNLSQLNEIRTENSSFQNDLENLRNELNNSKSLIDLLHQENAAKGSELNRAQSEIVEKTQEISDKLHEIVNLKAKIDQLQNKLSSSQIANNSTAESNERIISEKEHENESLRNTIDNLRNELQDKYNKINDLQKDNELAQNIRRILNGNSDQDIPRFVEKDTNLAKNIRTIFQSGDDDYIINSVSNNRNSSNEIDNLRNELNSKVQELESYSNRFNESEQRVREANEQIESLRNQNNELNNKFHELENSQISSNFNPSNNDELQRTLNNLQIENDHLKQRLDEQQNEYIKKVEEARIRAVRSNSNIEQEELNNLKEKLEKAEQSSQTLQQKHSDEMTTIQLEMDSLKKEKASLQEKLNNSNKIAEKATANEAFATRAREASRGDTDDDKVINIYRDSWIADSIRRMFQSDNDEEIVNKIKINDERVNKQIELEHFANAVRSKFANKSDNEIMESLDSINDDSTLIDTVLTLFKPGTTPESIIEWRKQLTETVKSFTNNEQLLSDLRSMFEMASAENLPAICQEMRAEGNPELTRSANVLENALKQSNLKVEIEGLVVMVLMLFTQYMLIEPSK